MDTENHNNGEVRNMYFSILQGNCDKYYSRYTKCFGDIGENIIITGVRIKKGFTEKVIFKGDVKGMIILFDVYRWKQRIPKRMYKISYRKDRESKLKTMPFKSFYSPSCCN